MPLAKVVPNKVMTEFLIGGLASCFAEAVTLPFDTLKVRMQIAEKRQLIPTLAAMVKNEGFASLFNGFEPAIIRQIVYGSMR